MKKMKTHIFVLVLLLLTMANMSLFAQKADKIKFGLQKKIGEPRKTIRINGRELPVLPASSSIGNPSNSRRATSPPKTIGAFNALFSQSKLQKTSKIEDVRYDNIEQPPVFLSLKMAEPITTTARSQEAVVQQTLDLLLRHKNELQIKNPASEFKSIEVVTDEIGMQHVKLQQQYEGLPVWGKQLFVHYSPSNGEVVMNGRYAPSPELATILPYFTPESATMTAENHLAQRSNKRELTAAEKKLLHYEHPQNDLIVWIDRQDPTKAHLAYHIMLRPNFLNRYEYFVDANNGQILDFYNHTCTDGPTTATAADLNGQSQSLHTYQISSTYYMIDASRPMYSSSQSNLPDDPVGAIWCITANNTFMDNVSHVSNSTNVWTNAPRAVSAQSNAGRAYEYYRTTHNRNSLNGQNGTIISVINVTEAGGQQLDNAFWNGQFMAYGNGSQLFNTPLAAALDVAGHEMTHGVIENNGSGGLEYVGQAGALNESFADVFGAMIDRDDWLIGEGITNTSYIPSGALRNMSNPHNGASSSAQFYWQPANMSEYQNMPLNEANDNGGVHINSGIPNRAYYLFATAITKDKAERVYYRALTQYLTNQSQFIDCRLAVVQAARDLYGNNSYEMQQAGIAFDSVGVYDGTSGNNETGGSPSNADAQWPAVNGTDWILAYSYLASDPNALYVIKPINPTSADLHPLTQVAQYNKPSVSDDGSVAVFIGSDHNIYAASTDYNNPQVNQLTDTGDWDNVAISRDASKMALVSSNIDHTIYVYNFDTQQMYSFPLYNPTYSQGASSTGGVQYADALDWDFTGEYVLYDAYNQVSNTSGQAIDFWDVNFVNVWNNQSNAPAEGQVFKLYSSLPAGISIGDAVFSKNSPNIVAFDVIDNNNSSYAIAAANVENGNSGVIIEQNTVLGTPSYSKNDNSICYTTTNASGEVIIARQGLTADKLNGSGSPVGIASGFQWPVWFTVGTRPNLNCVEFSVNITAQGSTDICNGSSVVLNAGSGYSSYAWSGGGNAQTKTVSTAGSYTVTVSNNGCTAVSPPINISIKPQPQASFTSNLTGSIIQLYNGSLYADSFTWNFGDGTTSNEPNPLHTYTSVGNKTITLTASSSCGSNTTSQTFTITVVGIEDNHQPALQAALVPNPNNGYFNVLLEGIKTPQTASITLLDIAGKQIANMSAVLNENTTSIPISIDPANTGLYFLRIETQQGVAVLRAVVR